jgi:hypothetical protein
LFVGKSLGSAPREIAEMPIPPPSVYNSDVSPALDTVVLRALQRDPSKRFSTARELSLALERVLADAGDSVAAAHVADWLEDLFPGRAVEKRGIRAMAQAMGTALSAPSIGPRGSSAAPKPYASIEFFDESSGASASTELALKVSVALPEAPKAAALARPSWPQHALMWRKLALVAAWLALFALSFYVAVQLGSLSLGLIDEPLERGGAVAAHRDRHSATGLSTTTE